VDTPEDVVRAYFAAINDSNVDEIVTLFADDGALMADYYQTATGTAAIRVTYEGAFAAMKMQHELHLDRVLESGDLAVVRIVSTGTVTLLEPGTTTAQNHREIFVLRRSSKGWRITDYMFNSPAAEET
jgi:uncharacterized protein (TIGR02246 family)